MIDHIEGAAHLISVNMIRRLHTRAVNSRAFSPQETCARGAETDERDDMTSQHQPMAASASSP